VHQLLPGPEGDDVLTRCYVDPARPAPDGRPWVVANMVGALDGTAAVDGRSAPLSSPGDRRVFHVIRSVADVILVGAGTARTERYGPHAPPPEAREARVGRGQRPTAPIAVVSASLRLDWESPLFTRSEARPVVVTTAGADPAARACAEAVADVVVAGDDGLDLGAAVDQLGRRYGGVVLTEGGPSLLAALLAADLVDELCLTLSPWTGGDALAVGGGAGAGADGRPRRRFAPASACAEEDHVFLRYVRAAATAG
jgi:riboflavin biosynthesis pyrimidine reductase